MTYRPEPAYRHGSAPRTAVLLVNLGTPDAPTAPALRRYLAEFLSDPRVVEIPRLLWWPILHGIILRTRPAKSAAKYASVWLPEGSPLAVWTARQANLLDEALQSRGHRVIVRRAMRYGQPAIGATLDALRAEGVTRMLVLPLYPQYAAATTASVSDAVLAWAVTARRMPELRFVGEYHDHPGYIDALAAQIGDDSPALPCGLTQREVEVLKLVAIGRNNRDVAAVLDISAHTVANHMRSILEKTYTANRTEAAAFAQRHGLVQGGD